MYSMPCKFWAFQHHIIVETNAIVLKFNLLTLVANLLDCKEQEHNFY